MNEAPHAIRRRRWLRWVIFLLLLIIIPFAVLGSIVVYEMVRPLPDYDRLPPVDTAKRYSITRSAGILPASETNSNHAGRMPALLHAPTSAPLLAVPTPWPPLAIPDNAPQILKDQAAQFARVQIHLEECRRAYEAYAAIAPQLDFAASSRRLQELQEMVIKVEIVMDAICDRLQLARRARDPIDQTSERINALRDSLLGFSLDHYLRFDQWDSAGYYLYYFFDDWDRAVFYWRRAGLVGSLRIGQAAVYRLDRGFWRHIGNPVDDFLKNTFEKILGVNL